MGYDLGAAQRTYDNRAPAEYEPELPQVEIIDRAIDMLKSASRLYNQTTPKLGEASGTVEDVVGLLLRIPGITLDPAVKARFDTWMSGRAA